MIFPLTNVSIQRLSFYNHISSKHNRSISFGNEHDFTMITGDFNLVQDPLIDYYNYKHVNNPAARREVLNMIQEISLVDPWRVANEQVKKFTWSCKNPTKRARLDFYLISEELMPLINNTDIKQGYRTDHNIIEVELKLSDFKKQAGFWKFNNSLLGDKMYVQKIKQAILDLKMELAATPYVRTEIPNISNETLEFTLSDHSFFEQLLLRIRGAIISYSSFKKKERNSNKKILETQIQLLDRLISTSPQSIIFQEMLTNCKEELENIRKAEVKGIFLRSKAKLIEEGEKPTKYFCHLEKRNFTNKTVTKLINNKGETINSQLEILKEIENFYFRLYSSRDENLEDVNLENIANFADVNKLDINSAQKLEGHLTYSEVLNAVKFQKMTSLQAQMGSQVNFSSSFGRILDIFS